MSTPFAMTASSANESSSSHGHACSMPAAAAMPGFGDLYEGYNDIPFGPDSQALRSIGSKSESEVVSSVNKPESFTAYDPIAVGHSQTSSMSENQVGKSEAYTVRTPTPNVMMASLWRPPSTGITSRALSGTASVAAVEPSTRPMTAVRSAGYSSRGSKFDPLNQAARAMTPAPPKKEESNPEYQSREMERLVNQLLEESAAAGLAGDHQLALEKAKEAGRRERLVCKHREQAGLVLQSYHTRLQCLNRA